MSFCKNHNGNFLYLTIPSFSETGLVNHGFTSRLGGVSKAPFNSMNLSIGRGDDPDAVKENYKIAGDAIGFNPDRLVFFPQVHKNDIFVAHEEDAGMGFRTDRPEYDGIITNVKNLPIATFHADCTPIFLLDPIKEVVGVVHAGWRGTALQAAGKAVLKMQEVFSCKPENILAGIGPCGGKCCYETHKDVPDAFISSIGDEASDYFTPFGEKYLIDLAGLNRFILTRNGILEKNITMSGICTCCNSDTYWSHRATGGVRGGMAAIIMLR